MALWLPAGSQWFACAGEKGQRKSSTLLPEKVQMLTVVKRLTDSIPEPTKGDAEYVTSFKKYGDGWKRSLAEIGALLFDIAIFYIQSLLIIVEAFLKFISPPQDRKLAGEIVLITGSGHGIGRELAFQFAGEGCTVVCWDKDEMANGQTVKLIKAKGFSKVHQYTCDISKREEVLEVAKKVAEEVGEVSILVNNAGIMPCKRVDSHKPDLIQRVFDINVMGHFWTIEAFLPSMKKQNRGHIVAICSMCGILGLPNAVPYCASKYAVRGMMDALYEELRAYNPKNQIKFSSIYPYTVDTGLVKKPRIRFPLLTPILNPEEVAQHTIKAVKQDLKELSVPQGLLSISNVSRFFPLKLIEHTRDFLDVGVDPEN